MTLLCIVVLSACINKSDINTEIIPKDENESSQSTSSESDVSEVSEGTSQQNVSSDYFKAVTDTAAYEFYPESNTGSYYTQFHSATKDANSITITLLDGRTMQLNYDEIIFDEAEQIYRTKINELDFMISEIHDSDNNLVQVFKCIEPLENLGDFNGKVESVLTVNYKPELENGEISMAFLYELDGDNVIIRYPDGRELTKKIKYNEDGKTFTFAE